MKKSAVSMRRGAHEQRCHFYWSRDARRGFKLENEERVSAKEEGAAYAAPQGLTPLLV
jgi:hypothetical protein